jgi:acyl-coenzyme A thioesterase PaaI-like protein
VFAGDTVVASGEVMAIVERAGEHVAVCSVRLTRDAELILTGTAEVAVPTGEDGLA